MTRKLYLSKNLLFLSLLVILAFTVVGYAKSYVDIVCYADGRFLPLRTNKRTVADLLKSRQIRLNELDVIRPGPKAELRQGMLVRVYRIAKEQKVKKEIIPPPTQVMYSHNILSGKSLVKQKGKEGLKEIVVESTCVDGEEIKASAVKEEVLRLPVPCIVVKGTRRGIPALSSLAMNGVKKVITMIATAYSDSTHSCGKWAGSLTSIGLKARHGVIAVDPRVIPLRTKLYIDGYGYGIAGDVGGAISGNRIDLCFNTHQEAVRYGRKKVKIYILE